MSIRELEKAIRAAAQAGLGILKKSQMAFNFTAGPNPHHVAYARSNASGTVSYIQAKGSHVVPPPSVKQEGNNMGITWRKINGEHHADLGGNVSANIRRSHDGKEWQLHHYPTDEGVSSPIASWIDTYRYLDSAKADASKNLADSQAAYKTTAEHPAKTAVKEWNAAELKLGDQWLDSTTEERETKVFQRERAALIKERDKALKEVRKHANKMTDAEWNAATEGTDSDREDFATEEAKNILTLPTKYPKTVAGWKQYIVDELGKPSSSEEEKRTGDYNKHLIYDFDSMYRDEKARAAINELLQSGEFDDHGTQHDDGSLTNEMWQTARGYMERLRVAMRDERETIGNSDTLNKVESVFMAAYDNAADSMHENGRSWKEDVYGPGMNPVYHQIAYGGIYSQSGFEEDQNVRDWYKKHGYSW